MTQTLGKTTAGETITVVPANYKRVTRLLAPQDVSVVKLSVYLDGQGPGLHEQVVRGIIYAASGALLAEGDEVTVLGGQEPGWFDLPFWNHPGGVPLRAGQQYDCGFHAGENGNVIRVYGSAT
jgi:hypothetical protein